MSLVYRILTLLSIATYSCSISNLEFPIKFSLLDLNRVNKLRQQAWGTCWAHATVASIESNLISTSKMENSPNLSEYYIDKFNGFNQNGRQGDKTNTEESGQGVNFQGSNSDDLSSGVIAHMGGDYKMAAAFLANHAGVPEEASQESISDSNKDYERFGDTDSTGIVKRSKPGGYLPTEIEFITSLGEHDSLTKFKIKYNITRFGSVSSLEKFTYDPISSANGRQIHFYRGSQPANHAVNIIGWDETIKHKFHKGAWLVRDSYHRDYNKIPLKSFYILYDDIYVGKDLWMGGVSFRNTKKMSFDKVFSHSLHGWQYSTSTPTIQKIANRFSITNKSIEGVGLWFSTSSTSYTIEIRRDHLDGEIVYSKNGQNGFPGYRFIAFDNRLIIKGTSDYYFILTYSDSHYPYDNSFYQYVALENSKFQKVKYPIFIKSKSDFDESFLYMDGQWIDTKTKTVRYLFQDSSNIPIITKENNINWSMNLYARDIE